MTDLNLALQCLGAAQSPKHSGPREQCLGEPTTPKHSIPRGSLSRIADRFGCGRANVSRVLAGHYKSERIAAAICAAAGLRAADLWPGAYPRLEKLQALQAAEAARPPAH
jgi:hypothetical protein